MNLTITWEAIYDGESTISHETVDLSNERIRFAIVVGFGNGIYEEMRVVGHSKEAAFYFVRLIQRGGYQLEAESAVRNKKLYRIGDACFPVEDPFVFISPLTIDGERIEFGELEDEIQKHAVKLEAEIASKTEKEVVQALPDPIPESGSPAKKKWWRFW